MSAERAEKWVTVSTHMGFDAEHMADLMVAALHGSGIPALRLPVSLPMTMLVGKGLHGLLPIRVLVPPERATEAKEIAGEQTPGSVHPRLRSVAQWVILAYLLMTVWGLLPFYGRRLHGSGGEFLISLAGTMAALMLVGQLIALGVALQRERKHVLDWRVVAMALLCWGALGLLMLPLQWAHGAHLSTVEEECRTAMVLVVYSAAAILVPVWVRGRKAAKGNPGP